MFGGGKKIRESGAEAKAAVLDNKMGGRTNNAGERHWKHILIVSWRYHLPRARLVFNQCLSDTGVSAAAKAVPRHYVLPVWYWQYLYLYQFAGIVKAVASDRC